MEQTNRKGYGAGMKPTGSVYYVMLTNGYPLPHKVLMVSTKQEEQCILWLAPSLFVMQLTIEDHIRMSVKR